MNNLKAENLGQINLYLNYYEQVINDENYNKQIGIILCTEKDNVMMEFALSERLKVYEIIDLLKGYRKHREDSRLEETREKVKELLEMK